MQYTREELIAKLKAEVARKKPIVIAGVGIGMAARAVDMGGADIIGLYHSSYYRWERCNFNDYRIDNNALVLKMMMDISILVKDAAVIAGVLGNDSTRDMSRYFLQLKDAGASGVMAFPTVILSEGYMRECMEEAGIGLEYELQNMAKARECGLFTISYALNFEEHVEKIVGSGADMILMHMGMTTGGVKPRTETDNQTLDECVERINRLAKIAKRINPDVFILAHGGAISAPDDTDYIYKNTDVVGFLGASSVERIPVEQPIMDQVKRFKSVKMR